ncbi:MAG TPA: carboxypeptidase regulatory-like domain-containing protein [Gemmatimonadales bacterium]|nr:carboxypeptidase regulatory-like domain-containing protein [Gemmatimonadales bacterium]
MRAAPQRIASLLVLLLAVVRPLAGQAVTTAIVQGTVAGQDSGPIANAVVEVTNTATGQFWRVETSDAGRYFFGTVAIGGPYQVGVRAIGFVSVVKTGILLNAGQRFVVDFFLEPTVVALPELVVQATPDPQANHGRTGPAQLVSDSALRQLPNLAREVTDLAFMSPQASRTAPFGDMSIGGQNPRYTTYLVDGGQNTDLYFGGIVAGFGLPRSISPDAVAQLQVLAAPADVRNGDFAGGAINIVTRSGTNEWHGSLFGFLQNDALVGTDVAGNPPGNFSAGQFGATLSGPIVKNRLQFFLNADLQHPVAPDPGPFITDTAGGADTLRIGIRYASVARFDSILTHSYGLETGGVGRSDYRAPAGDLFAKLSAQAGADNQLELSDHFARVHPQNGPDRYYGYYGLGSTGSQQYSTENALRLTWRGLFSRRWSNEMILGYLWTKLEDPSTDRADITVLADNGEIEAQPWNAGGYHFVLTQRNVEFTDNVTVNFGSHVVTFGTHNELLHFQDNGFGGSGGSWNFESLDSLAAGQPDFYERWLPGPLAPSGPDVNFHASQLGLYAQDQWAVSRQVTLTFGLRMDLPFLADAGALNPALRDSLGLETGQFPSGNPLWSPRLGVNYDIGGRGRTFLRGSAGLFSGHPPYRWIANGYHDSGGEQLRLTCTGPDAPHFDPLNPPTTCGPGPKAIQQITVFDRGLKYPQNWKFALGLDQRLPWGLVATADLLYTHWVNQFYFTDANLTPPVGRAAGEGGRLLYGSIDSSGTSLPSRLNAAFGPVVRVSNSSGDQAFLASLQLQRQFGSGFGLSASYTYMQAKDAFSLINFGSGLNLAYTPLDGSLADRQLRTSVFNVPHRVAITASVGLPFRSRLSLTYQGSSQGPYSYVVGSGSGNSGIPNFGDVNADGINSLSNGGIDGQDLIYVPRDVRPGGDISLFTLDSATGTFVPASASEYAKLDRYITNEQCLNRQRGQIMARNSCRNPWNSLLNAQLAMNIPTLRGQSIQLTADVQNLPALLNASWMTNRTTSGGEPALPLLRLQGYDTVKERGIYSLDLPARNQVDLELTRWRMQLGVRYSF